jgi:serine/threonine protein kinase
MDIETGTETSSLAVAALVSMATANVAPDMVHFRDMPETLNKMEITPHEKENFRAILEKVLFHTRRHDNIKYLPTIDKKGDTIYSNGKIVGLLRKKGAGANATVMKITFLHDNFSIAIKIGEIRSTLREHRFLTELNDNNPDETKSIHIIDSFRNCIIHNDLAAIIMSCYDADLACLIRSSKFDSLKKSDVKYILFQIFKGLTHSHSLGVIHCDLKPANILIRGNHYDVAITDFGLAQLYSKENLNPHVYSRWHRAPEIISAIQKYSLSADIWSVGCILYELVTREVLFPGNPCGNLSPSEDETVGRIPLNVKGGVWDLINKEKENNVARSKLRNMKNSDPDLVDLFNQCIQFKPEDRITAAQALNHPYFAGKL